MKGKSLDHPEIGTLSETSQSREVTTKKLELKSDRVFSKDKKAFCSRWILVSTLNRSMLLPIGGRTLTSAYFTT